MIAQHRVKAHTLLQQRCEGLFEMLAEVTTAAIGVDVIASSNHKIKGCSLVCFKHLLGDVHLIFAPCPKIAHHWEAHHGL